MSSETTKRQLEWVNADLNNTEKMTCGIDAGAYRDMCQAKLALVEIQERMEREPVAKWEANWSNIRGARPGEYWCPDCGYRKDCASCQDGSAGGGE
jgi:hypothetical protein